MKNTERMWPLEAFNTPNILRIYVNIDKSYSVNTPMMLLQMTFISHEYHSNLVS